MHGRGPKLGSYVPLMSFNKFKLGLFEEKKISIFMGKNVHTLYLLWPFLAIKINVAVATPS